MGQNPGTLLFTSKYLGFRFKFMNVYSQSMELEYQGITSCSVASFRHWTGASVALLSGYIFIYITNIITIVGVISQPMGLKIPFLYPRHSTPTAHCGTPYRVVPAWTMTRLRRLVPPAQLQVQALHESHWPHLKVALWTVPMNPDVMI